MKKISFRLLASILFLSATANSDAYAQTDSTEAYEAYESFAAGIREDVRCGNYGDALEKTILIKELIRRKIQSKSGRGYCYIQKNCVGPRVVSNQIPKDACDAALGMSWQSGEVCQNL